MANTENQNVNKTFAYIMSFVYHFTVAVTFIQYNPYYNSYYCHLRSSMMRELFHIEIVCLKYDI